MEMTTEREPSIWNQEYVYIGSIGNLAPGRKSLVLAEINSYENF